MKRLVAPLALAALASVSACSDDGAGDRLPAGTFAGSTKDDRAFVLEVGKDVKVNKHEARFLERGVVEVRARADGVRTTLTCKVTDDDGEELRCDVRTVPRRGPATTEVVDLMLL